jgi:membrane protease YdiL (CAAX protease family)
MNAEVVPQKREGRYPAAAVLLCLGSVVIGWAGYWHAIPRAAQPVIELLLAVLWLLLAWLAGRNAGLKPYRSVLLAFFAVSLGLWLDWLIGGWPLQWLGLSVQTLPGMAAAKLFEVLPIVAVILIVNRLEGRDLGALSLRRGRLVLSLLLGIAVGGLCFLFFLAMGGWQALVYAGPARLLAALPMLAVFVVANAFMEELWFRGLFLNRFEGVLGPTAALIVATVAFGSLHAAGNYASGAALVQFVAFTFVLGLAWGWLVQRTRTLWGSVLSHAIGDVFVLLGFFLSML